MKVLKVTFEIPLSDKRVISALKDVDELIDAFEANLAKLGYDAVRHEETIVTRPGQS